ncbi:hypothetical protein D9M70_631640 [compost metagenome]
MTSPSFCPTPKWPGCAAAQYHVLELPLVSSVMASGSEKLLKTVTSNEVLLAVPPFPNAITVTI